MSTSPLTKFKDLLSLKAFLLNNKHTLYYSSAFKKTFYKKCHSQLCDIEKTLAHKDLPEEIFPEIKNTSK